MVNVTDVSSTHCRSGVPGPKAVLLGVEESPRFLAASGVEQV